MKTEEFKILERALGREKAARKEAERILEEKSRNLFLISRELQVANNRLEQLLSEKSSELKGIFENINDAYIVIDLAGNVLRMNEVAVEYFGYNIQKESINLQQIIYYKDAEYAYDSFETLLEDGSYNNYTARIITKTKEIKWVQVNASLIYNKLQKPIAAQGIVRDITGIKNLELQKEKILKELESSNNQLQEYAHVVSHDLKSPLRSLDALVNWIKTDNIDSFDVNTLNNIKLIEETLGTMDALISDILEYSTAGFKNEKEYDIDLQVLVEELKKLIYVPKHITITIIDKLPVVKGDKIKFKQLFQNLLSNAIKFIDKEEGIINIKYQEEKAYHRFFIEDNGIGIDEKYHEKIFKIFQTLHNHKESTGIGLSIVKKIIDLYQGNISLTSKPNIGTTFIFTLKK